MRKTMRCGALFLMIATLLLGFAGCTTDYSEQAQYQAFFLNTDSTEDKEVKNCIIDTLTDFNNGNFRGYVDHFDWERAAKRAFVKDMKDVARSMQTTYEIQAMQSAVVFDSRENAQVGVTVVKTVTDLDSGEIEMQVRSDITYTLSRKSGEWLILEEEANGENDDYLVS